MKNFLLFLLLVVGLSAQTIRENIQRQVGTNVITGSQAQFPFQISLLANLKLVPVTQLNDAQVTSILGYTSVGDGGGGQFQYDFDSVDAPNDTTVVLPLGGVGRWLRISYINLAAATTFLTGTANQVLVNGTSGSPQDGSMTLTTPQDIGTTSTPRFGKIGLGVAASANSDLLVMHSVPALTAQASVHVTGGLSAPAATDLHPNAFRDTTTYVSTVAADAYTSYDAQTVLGGTQPYNHYYGYQARHSYQGSNTLGVMAGFAALNMGVGVGGTVTKLRGFYVSDTSISGTVTDFDGLYIDQLTAGTNRAAIRIAGNDQLAMGGGQIWTSVNLTPITATSRLSVTYNQTTQTGIDVMNLNTTYTGYHMKFYSNAATLQGSVQQVDASTIAFQTTSDARLKENFRDVVDSGKIIDGLRPRVFDWKKGKKNVYGFIAQEVKEVYPQAVRVGGADASKEPWQMEKADLVPVLTAEVKALRARVKDLEDRSPWPAAIAAIVISVTISEIRRRKTK